MKNTVKLKIYGGLAKAKNAIDKAFVTAMGVVPAVCATVVTASAQSGASGGTAPVIDVSSVDFSGLTNAITSMVPQILPVAVTILGIRKAISFLMSTIRGC